MQTLAAMFTIMRKLLLTLIFSVVTCVGFSQHLVLDIRGKKVTDFIKLENQYGSTKFEPNSAYIHGEGIPQPLIFRYKESVLPDLLSYYFYYQSDSTLESILYEWDDKNFKSFQENEKNSDNEIAAFIERYMAIYDSIFQTYGKSQSKGDLTDRSKIVTGDFERMDIWKPNQNTEIKLYIVLSSFYQKKGPITINPTYRIRLFVKNVK